MPQRGGIYFSDKNGTPVAAAITKAYPVIFAVPKDVKDPELMTAELSGILNIKNDKLFSMLNKGSEDEYELLVKKASNGQVDKIKELKPAGIYIEEENFRFYPLKTLASHVLGFVGSASDNSGLNGRYGLELLYNGGLGGEEGRLDGERVIKPIAGKNIYLTIDSNIETAAEEVLFNLIQKYSADQGMVMVQDPKTGKILAMGAYPNFDPNNFSDYKIGDFLNPIVQSVFEPGSVMKVITMAAGLDSGKLTADTTFYDSGSLTLNGFTIKNWDKKPWQGEMTEVIEGQLIPERLMPENL